MSPKSFNLLLKSKIPNFKKTIEVDADKSLSIRSFIIGSISQGVSKILNVLDHALESTKSMEAKVGRAKFLDTKGIGITDPGAFSTTLILKEFFKEFVNEKNN